MNNKLNLSVHELVDTLLRTGDIDSRIFNTTTMSEGAKIHRAYQQKMEKDYLSEYFLSKDFEYEGIDIHIEGRADGIIPVEDFVIIDEIKTCVGDLTEFHEKNEEWHLGQAKVYGYLYCSSNETKNVNVSLTYISQEDFKIQKKYFYQFTFDELEDFFFQLVDQYLEIYNLTRNHKIEVRQQAKELKFPYSKLNKYQKELMEFVYNTESVKDSRSMIEAPTGIGKTVSFLYPSIKNLSKYDRIFYLTAKNSGKEIVDDTLTHFEKDGFKLKSVILTAKEKICPMDQTICNPDECPFARNYYSKLRNLLTSSFISETNIYDLKFFNKMMVEHQICPFEFQLDLSLFCDLIIGDYNYIFDPFVALERYVKNDLSNTLLLVDEAHNLIDRVRGMYSATISLQQILNTQKSLKHLKNKTIKNNLNKLKAYFEDSMDFYADEKYVKFDVFEESLLKIVNKTLEHYKTLSSKSPSSITKQYKDLFTSLNRFMKLLELMSTESFAIKFFKNDEINASFNIMCSSPTRYIDLTTLSFRNALLFSATLSPSEYYHELFFNKDDEINVANFESPFDSNRLNFMISKNISIKYKDRQKTISQVASQIVAFTSCKTGNYFVFVPSYEYLNLLKEKLTIDNAELIYQDKEMNDYDKNVFINKFKEESDITRIGVCVLGGSFSESINLVGESLIGVVIVGVGMPSICFENDQMKEYYNSIELDGFYYSYLIPGMKNVIQAVGRLIRTNKDYGSVLLIDERYGYSSYRNLFKKEWKNYKIVQNDYEIIKNLDIFYKKILNQ